MLSVPNSLGMDGEIRVITIEKNRIGASDLVVIQNVIIREQIKEYEKIVLDCTNVKHIDAGWLTNFAENIQQICQEHNPPINLVMIISQEQPKGLIGICRLKKCLQIFHTLEEAIGHLNNFKEPVPRN